MRHHFVPGLLTAVVVGLAACGPAEETDEGLPETPGDTAAAPATPGGGTASVPSWMRVNGNQVELDIVAGASADNNHWNFNGAANGAMTITVPQGAQVTINFRNADPAMAHSIGVAPPTTPVPAQPAAEPAIPGAITANAADVAQATLTGERETITFTAATPGQYTLLCYIPGHGLAGMWVRFNVGGEAGVTGAPNVPITMQ
jgi:sulfocyanin